MNKFDSMLLNKDKLKKLSQYFEQNENASSKLLAEKFILMVGINSYLSRIDFDDSDKTLHSLLSKKVGDIFINSFLDNEPAEMRYDKALETFKGIINGYHRKEDD